MNLLSEQLLQELYREQYGNQANLIRELDARQGIRPEPIGKRVMRNNQERRKQKFQEAQRKRRLAA